MRASRAFVVAMLALGAGLAHAEGGPPLLTDDPGTVEPGHWEINLAWTSERSAAANYDEAPLADINYGLNETTQLKFEMPLSVTETRGNDAHVAAGPGNSLLGVKWRFYAHHPKSEGEKPAGERESTFGLSIYPQLMVNNPTRSVDRGIVDPGPQFLLPVEASAVLGPLRISGEVGYWFTEKNAPRSWTSGVVVGHEFRKNTELYAEFSDQKEVGGTDLKPALRETTLGVGERVPITPEGRFRLIGMAGHSVVPATPTNGQPGWIAYVGIQFLSSSSRRRSSDYMETGGQ